MVRFLRFAALAAISSCVLAVPFFRSAAVINNPMVSVIVEFSDDPGAVYLAKAKQRGAMVSDDQMRSYRNGLTSTQDQFLNALKTQGINFQLQSVNVKDATGNVAGSVPMRYTLVYNGVTLTVPEAAVPTISHMAGQASRPRQERRLHSGHASLRQEPQQLYAICKLPGWKRGSGNLYRGD
jgi:hypothetical protein